MVRERYALITALTSVFDTLRMVGCEVNELLAWTRADLTIANEVLLSQRLQILLTTPETGTTAGTATGSATATMNENEGEEHPMDWYRSWENVRQAAFGVWRGPYLSSRPVMHPMDDKTMTMPKTVSVGNRFPGSRIRTSMPASPMGSTMLNVGTSGSATPLKSVRCVDAHSEYSV